MGMCAEIVAIGPFQRWLIPHLDYPEEHYADTREGAIVTLLLFGILEGSSLSRDFANLLGVTDPWDHNQHKLDPRNFDREGLMLFGAAYDTYDKDVNTLLTLANAGWEFHFRPNG